MSIGILFGGLIGIVACSYTIGYYSGIRKACYKAFKFAKLRSKEEGYREYTRGFKDGVEVSNNPLIKAVFSAKD